MPPKTKLSRANVYNRDCPSQGILALIGSKWSMLVLCALRAGPRRTHELKRRLEGVSAKMLTQTLRELERHGIVAARISARCRRAWSTASLRSDARWPGSWSNIEEWVTANYTRMTGSARRYDATVDAH